MNSLITQGVGAGAGYGVGKSSLAKDDFMKLLVTQLEHQDPLNPVENTEFIAQLAQFSTLEGITNVEKGIGKMNNYLLSMNNSYLTGLIGKGIKTQGNTILFDGSNSKKIDYSLGGNAAKVNITIYDENGKEVRKIEAGSKIKGVNTVLWDGRDFNGKTLPKGEYNISVNAVGSDGASIGSGTLFTGKVDSVMFENGTPYLIVDGIRVSMSSVLEVLN
ncbi:MAG: hypothetical protein HZC45_08720 [Deltaproteobacteria bacterium]|nr:hypothetical protein [Deltaproteobacteria bacterium]